MVAKSCYKFALPRGNGYHYYLGTKYALSSKQARRDIAIQPALLYEQGAEDLKYLSFWLSHIHAHQIHLDYPHELGDKSLQVKYDLGSRSYSVLVKGGPLDNFIFQIVVNHRDKFKSQGLEDSGGGYAVRKKIV